MSATVATRPLWLGAPSPGGLALPAAQPTRTQFYAPRGLWFDDERLVVADSGNHRLLLWYGLPESAGTPADIVLGQPNATSEGPRAGGRGPENGFHLPTGVAVYGGRLFLADAWHHRILVWERLPRRDDQPPDWVLGQPSLAAVEPNRGGPVSAVGLYWPYGVAVVAGNLWVTDTGNRRVLGWFGVPEFDRPADVVLGQPDFSQADENRGGAPSASSFRWPHGVAAAGGAFYVADAGNHRVLGWPALPRRDEPADRLLGQRDFGTAFESQYQPQSATSLRFPYAVAGDGERLLVADTANNRVLLWPGAPTTGTPAVRVFGQDDLVANGENRWREVRHDSLCWPYGLWLHGDLLGIADSGNNRVLLWPLAEL
ncbi:MAG: NHL repeat-containing protein [Thermoanaerobaculia bacterium]|nr:NHL repeat-containing protein [Thermoanaerobaculia bacterium]